MPPLHASRRLYLTLMLGAFIVSSLLPGRFCVYAPPLSAAVATILSPLSEPLKSLSAGVRARVDQPVLLDGSVARLSDELRRKDALIHALTSEVAELRKQNAALQELRRRVGADAFVFRDARVIGRSADPSSITLQLDIGGREGVVAGSAVVESANLIGRVGQVGRASSTIDPITVKGSRIDAVVTPPVLPPGGLDPNRRICQFEAINPDLLVAVVPHTMTVNLDDYAHLQDRTWPHSAQGFILGRVVAIHPVPDDLLRKRIEVRPMRSIAHVQAVTVIVPRDNTQSPGGEGGAK